MKVYQHQQANVVCNHCGGVFTNPSVRKDDASSVSILICPYCGVDPKTPFFEKGGLREENHER